MGSLFHGMPLYVAQLIIGFVFLVKGADIFVDGSSNVAKRLKVPSIIIGLTIVAMGTSLPETAVSVSAALTGNNALAVSNAVGSNIFNLMVVIGACALFQEVPVERTTLKREFPISVFCAILLLILGYIHMSLGMGDGITFIILFAAFIFFMVQMALRARRDGLELAEEEDESEEEDNEKLLSPLRCIVYIVLGGIAIALGGDWVVESASGIAKAFGISQTLIGLTIVAFGTSLPELVTSIVAASKGEVDMALGNAIGSNIFNVLMVLGIAAVASPIAFIAENIIDILVLVGFSILVWWFAWTKSKLNRKEGVCMLILYTAYLIYICVR